MHKSLQSSRTRLQPPLKHTPFIQQNPPFSSPHFSLIPSEKKMKNNLKILSNLSVLAYYATLLPFGASFTSFEDVETHNKSIRLDNIDHKVMNPRKVSEITLHGVISWVSMGVLVPLGVLTIRMSHGMEGGKGKVLLYLHVIFQMLAALLATSGAIMSMKSFENAFDNNHQRIGLALYGAIWVQTVLGFLRPKRGCRRRKTWYFVHWILGTIVSLVGIINIYTGLSAYHKKVSRSTRLWTIIFTAQVSFMTFFYLFQDKWAYMQKQGVAEIPEDAAAAASDHENQKRLVLLSSQPCRKPNALKNLFD